MGQGTKDEDYPSDAEIVAMTIRHGADQAKRYLDALALRKAYEEGETERLAACAADLPRESQAKVLSFPSARKPKP